MIVRFVQRFASFFAILTGLLFYRLVLPDSAPCWVGLATALTITVATYLVLHKNGVTGNRPNRP